MAMRCLGNIIGSGTFKTCHEIVGEPNKVALVGWSGQRQKLKEEQTDLKLLRKKGLPVLKTRLQQVATGEHKERYKGALVVYGLVCDRYDFGIKPWHINMLAHKHDIKYLNMLKNGHLRKFHEINNLLNAHSVAVCDLQFLLKGEDEVVIADPLSVNTNAKHNDPCFNDNVLNKLEKVLANPQA
jgi:hypothetical protein